MLASFMQENDYAEQYMHSVNFPDVPPPTECMRVLGGIMSKPQVENACQGSVEALCKASRSLPMFSDGQSHSVRG